MRWYALRTGVVLACLSGMALGPAAPARAAFATELSGLPDEFTAGDRVATVSAVVSRTDPGRCVKVRWSMVLTVRGIRLDQVKVDRVEETGSFPLEIRTDGDVARLTDRQLDPARSARTGRSPPATGWPSPRTSPGAGHPGGRGVRREPAPAGPADGHPVGGGAGRPGHPDRAGAGEHATGTAERAGRGDRGG